MTFTALPPELIEEILVQCDPIGVSKAAQTCRTIRNVVYGSTSETLWRELYLSQLVDDPRQCVTLDGQPRPPIKWKEELQRLVRVETLTESKSVGRPGEIGTVLQTILDLISFVPPRTTNTAPSNLSTNLIWTAVQLRNGWIDLVEQQALSSNDRQLVARFHTSYGLTQNDARKKSRAQSRGYVYNKKNYTAANDFGPYTDSGKVNWVHVQALHHVVSMHVVLAILNGEELDPDNYEYAIYPLSLPFTQIVAQDPSQGNDWAGVTGEWSVSFCFCDHRDILGYNQDIQAAGLPEDISVFEEDGFEEVFRSMKAELRVVRTEPDMQHPGYPVIFFDGNLSDMSQSRMDGKVWMDSEGFVRWRFISGEQNNAIWSSEGLQIGGLRSSYGVLGAWSTIFHEADDPVGPFWLRRKEHGLGAGLHTASNS